MIDNVDELITKAVDNKQDIKRKTLDIMIGDEEQSFRISGIGQKAVKIEKYVKYEDIIEAVVERQAEGLESALLTIIDEFEPGADEDDEL